MSNKPKLLLSLGMLLFVAVRVSAAPAVVTEDVNLRAGPNTGHRILTVVPSGASVDVMSCSRWCLVRFARYEGYLSGNYIALATPPTSSRRYDDYDRYWLGSVPGFGFYFFASPGQPHFAGPRFRRHDRIGHDARRHNGWSDRHGLHGGRHFVGRSGGGHHGGGGGHGGGHRGQR